MRIEVVTPPQPEPISTEEAKAYLAVDFADDDPLVEGLVTAARAHVEEMTGRALGEQTLRLVLDRWPCGPTLPLPRPPLLEVVSVKYLDPAGELQTLSPDAYTVHAEGTPGAIYAPSGWPATARRPDAVRVEFRAGYGDAGEALPEQLAVAIKQLVRHWYDQRTPVAMGTIATRVPNTLETLTASLRFRYRLPD